MLASLASTSSRLNQSAAAEDMECQRRLKTGPYEDEEALKEGVRTCYLYRVIMTPTPPELSPADDAGELCSLCCCRAVLIR